VTQTATGPDSSRGSGHSRLRWWVLALAAIAVSSSYYEDDVIGPIADLLQRQRGFTQSQLGMLNGVISIPNVALALINGLMIDRYGPARVARPLRVAGPGARCVADHAEGREGVGQPGAGARAFHAQDERHTRRQPVRGAVGALASLKPWRMHSAPSDKAIRKPPSWR